MSFSFGAQGSKAETLASLAKATVSSEGAGRDLRDLLLVIVAEGGDQGYDGRPIRYEVSASGHTGKGQVPFLTVSLTAKYVSEEKTQ